MLYKRPSLTEGEHQKVVLSRGPVDHGPEAGPEGLRGSPELLKVPACH